MWDKIYATNPLRRKPGRRYRSKSRSVGDRFFFEPVKPLFLEPILGQRLQNDNLLVGRRLDETAVNRPIFGIQHGLLETISRQHRQLALILPRPEIQKLRPAALQAASKDVETLLLGSTAGPTRPQAVLQHKDLAQEAREGTYARLKGGLTSRTVLNDLDSIFKQQLANMLMKTTNSLLTGQALKIWPSPDYSKLTGTRSADQSPQGEQAYDQGVSDTMLRLTHHLLNLLPGGSGFTVPTQPRTRYAPPPTEPVFAPAQLRSLAETSPHQTFSDLSYPKALRKNTPAGSLFGYTQPAEPPDGTLWDLSPRRGHYARHFGPPGAEGVGPS